MRMMLTMLHFSSLVSSATKSTLLGVGGGRLRLTQSALELEPGLAELGKMEFIDIFISYTELIKWNLSPITDISKKSIF